MMLYLRPRCVSSDDIEHNFLKTIIHKFCLKSMHKYKHQKQMFHPEKNYSINIKLLFKVKIFDSERSFIQKPFFIINLKN